MGLDTSPGKRALAAVGQDDPGAEEQQQESTMLHIHTRLLSGCSEYIWSDRTLLLPTCLHFVFLLAFPS